MRAARTPQPPQPYRKRLTHQGGAPVAAGSHSGRSPVELRGHEVEAGVGAGPGHVPVNRRVGHAEGSRVGALHSQRVPQAQGCWGRGGMKGRGPGSVLAGYGRTSARGHPPGPWRGQTHPVGPRGPWWPRGGTAGHCWSLGPRHRPGRWGCWTSGWASLPSPPTGNRAGRSDTRAPTLPGGGSPQASPQ